MLLTAPPLLSPKPQQLAEVVAGPGAGPRKQSEDAVDAQVGSRAAPPIMRGAGDGAELPEGTRAGGKDPGPTAVTVLGLQEAGC